MDLVIEVVSMATTQQYKHIVEEILTVILSSTVMLDQRLFLQSTHSLTGGNESFCTNILAQVRVPKSF